MEKYGEVDSLDFAIYLNKKAKDKGISTNLTKIHKWLYVCYGLYLVINRAQLLNERPQAWQYGPAFPKVHNKQKKNGDSLDRLRMTASEADMKKYDDIIEATLKHFGGWTASELVAWTHELDGAWDRKFNNYQKYKPLEDLDILADFEKFVTIQR
ncbi:MAG: DUF4065 domain-containing protein [Defluviitaleaceae bacterium]|nr:DUF4065 domain-containing protein [Defluviitaleaceae bacterium]